MRPQIEVDQKSQPNFRKPLSQRAGLSYKHKEMSQAISFNGDSTKRFILKPPTQPRSKLMRTLKGKTDITLSPKVSPDIQVPSNRLSPVYIGDDDFM